MEEVDKMSHRLRTCGAAAVLLLLLTLLSSCGQSAVQDETATDYNQYIPSHGVTAYTKDLYIFFDSGRLFYVVAPSHPNCSLFAFKRIVTTRTVPALPGSIRLQGRSMLPEITCTT